MRIVCLDLEGVLVPEIWINVSKKTGIETLKLTTRDVPDYDELMRYRINILNDHKLSLTDIQDVIATMEPFPGALEFLDWLRQRTQVIILSDTFTEFAQPLMRALRWPTLFCNNLKIDAQNMIVGYSLRMHDGKMHAVKALQSIWFTVFAAGDSYNDLSMIRQADAGALFKAPDTIVLEQQSLPHAKNYDEFKALLIDFLSPSM